MIPEPDIRLCALLSDSCKVLVFTGAGISTGSGIPDFRGPGGVWTRRRPVLYNDFMTSEEARIEHWDYKLEGWEEFRMAEPNAVHQAIVALEKGGKLLKVVTQNIDGLHQKAGTSQSHLIELHGTNSQVECQGCQKRSDPHLHFEYFKKTRLPPRCDCGGLLKLATISFGQSLRLEDIQEAERVACEADLVIVLGSSLSVYPASSIPLQAVRRDIPYVIINRGPTEHDGDPALTLRLEGDVAVHFPPAVKRVLAVL